MITRRDIAFRGSILVVSFFAFDTQTVAGKEIARTALKHHGRSERRAASRQQQQLRQSLSHEFERLLDNFDLREVGTVDGSNLSTSGGTISGSAIVRQVQFLAPRWQVRPGPENVLDPPHLTKGRRTLGTKVIGSPGTRGRTVLDDQVKITKVYSNGTGYTFLVCRQDRAICSMVMGNVAMQDGSEYGGAMTILTGPNFVALRVLTDLLKERGYTSAQISDLCWPVKPSRDGAERMRSSLTFDAVSEAKDAHNNIIYLDRDVLMARAATCMLRYTHRNGVPDGGGEGALIVDGKEEFRFSFTYNQQYLGR